MKRFGHLPILLALLLFPGIAPAQVAVDSDALEITVGGRVQTQFNTTTIAEEAPSELILRRVRLEFEVRLNDLVFAAIEPEFAGGATTLKDAFVRLDFSPAVKVLAGQAYRPFGLIEQTSSARILPIERGLRVRGLDAADHYTLVNGLRYSDREIGVQVMGAPGFLPLGMTYQAGVFRGPLHGQSNIEDSYQSAARLTVNPLDVLRLGAGWSSRDFVATPASASDPFVRGHAFEVDFELGSYDPGLHVLGEVAFGDADPGSDVGFFGAQGWLAWRSAPLSRVISAVEPLVRASYGEVDGAAYSTTLVTPGVNVYFGGRNRLMVNYDLALLDGDVADDTEGAFRAQLQVAF